MAARRHFTSASDDPHASTRWDALPAQWISSLIKQSFSVNAATDPLAEKVALRVGERAEPRIEQTLSEPRRTLFSVMSAPDKYSEMLALSRPATGAAIPQTLELYAWPARDLLQLVNAPRFQDLTGWHNDYLPDLIALRQAMPDQELAVHLLGYVLAINGRRELKHAAQLNRQLWFSALEQAQLAWHWAPYQQLSPARAAALILAWHLAPMALLQVWDLQSECVREEHWQRARDNGQRLIYDALTRCHLPPGLLSQQLMPDQQFSRLKQLLAELGPMGRYWLPTFKELHSALPLRYLSPLARLLRQVMAFHGWLKLNEQGELLPAEAAPGLEVNGLNENDIGHLLTLLRPRKLPNSSPNQTDIMQDL